MNARFYLKLSGYLFALPLVLALFSGWQWHRSAEQATTLASERAEYDTAQAQLAQISRDDPMHTVEIDGRYYVASLAQSMLADQRGSLDTAIGVQATATRLPPVSAALAVVFALLGITTLLLIKSAAVTARASRDRLLGLFSLGRRLLPFVLVGQIVLLSLCVTTLAAFEALSLWQAQHMSTGEIKLMIAVWIIIASLLWSAALMLGQLKRMLAIFQPTPMDVIGRSIAPQQAPALWAYVNDLAERLKALPPTHIVVGLTEGFYVTSSAMRLHPSKEEFQGRTLYLPLHFLGLFDRDECSAVIGHELAHFSGEDTEYSMGFLPIYNSAGRSLHILASQMSDGLQRLMVQPAFLLGVYFIEQFDHAVKHWSRSRELRADSVGAQLAGAENAAAALVRTVAVMPRLGIIYNQALEHADSMPEDLPRHLLAELERQGLEEPRQHLAEHLPHPTDSHPATRARIEALGLDVERAVTGKGMRAVAASADLDRLQAYFPDPATLQRELTTDLRTEIVEHHSKVNEQLRAQAESVSETSVIYEGARGTGILLIVVGLIMLFGGLAILALWKFGHVPGAEQAEITGGASLVIGGLVALYAGRRFIYRARVPALTLTPDGMHFANLPGAVANHHIADFHIQLSRGVQILLLLVESAPAPAFSKAAATVPGAKFIPKKRLISLQLSRACVEGKGLKPKDLAELLHKYLQAGHARHALRQQEAARPSANA